MMTLNNIALYLPEINAVQQKKLRRLIIENTLSEYEAIRNAGWLDDNDELSMWVSKREQFLMERLAKL